VIQSYEEPIRVWNFNSRTIIQTVQIPTAIGTMDVRLIPGDPLGRAYTAGMFDGFVYLIDTFAGTASKVFIAKRSSLM
jgi:hypothetical protein